jgi:hypothetical protein
MLRNISVCQCEKFHEAFFTAVQNFFKISLSLYQHYVARDLYVLRSIFNSVYVPVL